MEIKLKPIGVARNREGKHFGGWESVVSELVIEKDYQEALEGLKDYSHIIVIYWMHKAPQCELRHIPQGKVGIVPEVGIFACRCSQRPNPIGISTVKLISVKDTTLTVQGLDVINNTPILDIKPYTPQYDAVSSVTVPEWVNKLAY